MHIYKTWGNYKIKTVSINVYKDPKAKLKGAVYKMVNFGNFM